MSKLKIGDKVVTPFGIGTLIEELEDLGYQFSIVQYKSPHERLLELGFIISDETVYHISYMLKELDITIFKKEKTYQAYSYGDNYNPIDLELAEILVDYLKELENE